MIDRVKRDSIHRAVRAALDPRVDHPVRYVWYFWARWWDCVSDGVDMCATTGTIPGLMLDRWSWVDLYEVEETCVAETQEDAEATFREWFPWITNYHIRLISVHRNPAVRNGRRRRKDLLSK